MDRKIIAAVDALATFKVGDAVTVKDSGSQAYEMFVSRELHRSDGAFGSYESSRIKVTFGPGRYSRDVTAEQLAAGQTVIARTEA